MQNIFHKIDIEKCANYFFKGLFWALVFYILIWGSIVEISGLWPPAQ